jgi:cell division septum initiation protein DivIVA
VIEALEAQLRESDEKNEDYRQQISAATEELAQRHQTTATIGKELQSARATQAETTTELVDVTYTPTFAMELSPRRGRKSTERSRSG